MKARAKVSKLVVIKVLAHVILLLTVSIVLSLLVVKGLRLERAYEAHDDKAEKEVFFINIL